MKKLIALMILMASPQLWANTCDWLSGIHLSRFILNREE